MLLNKIKMQEWQARQRAGTQVRTAIEERKGGQANQQQRKYRAHLRERNPREESEGQQRAATKRGGQAEGTWKLERSNSRESALDASIAAPDPVLEKAA